MFKVKNPKDKNHEILKNLTSNEKRQAILEGGCSKILSLKRIYDIMKYYNTLSLIATHEEIVEKLHENEKVSRQHIKEVVNLIETYLERTKEFTTIIKYPKAIDIINKRVNQDNELPMEAQIHNLSQIDEISIESYLAMFETIVSSLSRVLSKEDFRAVSNFVINLFKGVK